MTLSIITINYNNKDGLQKTINSVVQQRVKDFEWIIIDGGSTDGSKEVVEENAKHFAYWCSERDKGIYNAMNKGIKVANGDYCLFLNSGDSLHDDEVIGNVLKELDGTDFISGDTQNVNKQGEYLIKKITPKTLSLCYLLEGSLSHQSTFIRTELLKKRPYNESLKIVADWEQMFYEIAKNKRTYKRINIIVSDFMDGGISNSLATMQLHKEERSKILYQDFTQQQIDSIKLKHYSSIGDKKSITRMMEIAYEGITNPRYTQKSFKETFKPYLLPIPPHQMLRVRLFIWLSIRGYLPLVRTIFRLCKKK